MSPFQNNFLWGTATSAFQVEGHVENDFTDWEKEGRFLKNNKDPRYGIGSDHWTQWPDDFAILKKYNQNAYRFSVEWARIEPEKGVFNQQALNQYKRMLNHLLEMGITPMLTLNHFSHPKWFHQNCPWHEPQSVDCFISFSEKVVANLGSLVNLYITLNEPVVWVLAAYGDGLFPPGKKDMQMMMTALYNMLSAHAKVYEMIKSVKPDAKIGIAKHFVAFAPNNPVMPFDLLLKFFLDNFFNKMVPDAFKNNCVEVNLPFLLQFKKPIELNNNIDFWGINYYYRSFLRWRWNQKIPFEMLFKNKRKLGLSDLGWEIFPEGLAHVIKKMSAYGKDMYITENGIATDDDQKRILFLKEHLKVIQNAVKRGYPLKGYFHWSLLDNYEWLEGYGARFGLVHVDFENKCKRTTKGSINYYSDFIAKQK